MVVSLLAAKEQHEIVDYFKLILLLETLGSV